jgi:HK97 gp10 family phage protein
MKLKAKVIGREALYRRLNQLVPNAEKELAVAQLEVAQELADRVRPRAPRRTGRYAASIQGDKLSNRPGKKLAIGLRGQTKDRNATGLFAEWIWRFLEFGTVKMAARPHIFPTWRAYKKRARRKMAGAVNKAVRKARKK